MRIIGSGTGLKRWNLGVHGTRTAIPRLRSEAAANPEIRVAVDQQIATITINRPDRMNAISPSALDLLRQSVETLGGTAGIRAAILTGAGEKAFCTGFDIAGLGPRSAEEARESSRRGQNLTLLLESLPFPTIAAVQGYCLGGGLEIALSCSFIYVSTAAFFGFPEVRLGIIPAWGGTQRLTRAIGKRRAIEMIATGDKKVSADQALAWGLVNRVFKPEDLLGEALKTAQNIALGAPLAVQYGVEAIQRAEHESLVAGLESENDLYFRASKTEDRTEGAAAFQERRPPQWAGK